METFPGTLDILYAEDSEDDFSMFLDSVRENGLSFNIQRVNDGQELVDYFSKEIAPLPKLIICDLNMPRKNGFEAVREIREKPFLNKTPIIIFSNSQSNEDVKLSYDLGVNSFIQKPLSYQTHIECVKSIYNYWFKAVFPL